MLQGWLGSWSDRLRWGWPDILGCWLIQLGSVRSRCCCCWRVSGCCWGSVVRRWVLGRVCLCSGCPCKHRCHRMLRESIDRAGWSARGRCSWGRDSTCLLLRLKVLCNPKINPLKKKVDLFDWILISANTCLGIYICSIHLHTTLFTTVVLVSFY